MSYAFTFDASACTGCKACQAACKDKNDLPVGVLWRRVFEVSGGDWEPSGEAWLNTVFAYNYSMACNHCVHPKCAGVCPTNAYYVRDDGIVILDSAKCVGCGYCNWACPYAVPQYNVDAGSMSKCNFCFDHIEAGREPACVAACPMRVLGFAKTDELDAEPHGLPLWKAPASEHPFPMPDYSRTQPHVLLCLHPAMANELKKSVANQEEVRPAKAKSETPLVAFTLLGQMSVGAFWLARWMFTPLWMLVEFDSNYLRLFPAALVGLCLILGLGIAFAHLGKKRNVWRMLSNLKKSWLSKEILLMSLFGLGWFLSIFSNAFILYLLTGLLGYGLIQAMANVYSLRSMPVWNSWRTLAAFLLSSLLLGQFLLLPVLSYQARLTGIWLPAVYASWSCWFSVLLLAFELGMEFTANRGGLRSINRARIVLIILVMLGATLAPFLPVLMWVGYYSMLFGLLLIEEVIGRWLFYEQLSKRTL